MRKMSLLAMGFATILSLGGRVNLATQEKTFSPDTKRFWMRTEML